MYVSQSAVVVKRVEPSQEPDTTEAEQLARAAGFQVSSVITQKRSEDYEYHVGSGKVSEIHHEVNSHGESAVIFDNVLEPRQKYNLGLYFSTNIEVIDRYTLILKIFDQRATTKEAQLQVELAKLRYELPRAEAKKNLAQKEEKPGFMGLGEYDEKYISDLRSRIRRLQEKVEKYNEQERKRHEYRRGGGCELVAIAGYTNAGKTTLLQRLSKSLSVGEDEEIHVNFTATAEVRDSLFTTLDTTTRRMDYNRREILLTDTVGFIDDLPYWLVDSFEATLSSVYHADLVLLAVDASDSTQEMREKMTTAHDTMSLHPDIPVRTVFTKTDSISSEELQRKRDALSSIAPSAVPISAQEGTKIKTLKKSIDDALPSLTTENLVLPITDETMSLVSRIHDRTNVSDVSYRNNTVEITFKSSHSTIQKIRGAVEKVGGGK